MEFVAGAVELSRMNMRSNKKETSGPHLPTPILAKIRQMNILLVVFGRANLLCFQ